MAGRLDDDALVDVVRTVDVVGVDSPLGWPVAFVYTVEAHSSFRPWPGGVDRSTLTHRDTDHAIGGHGIRAPLSVSADKLGSVAMRCALLQRRWADEVWGCRGAADERLVERTRRRRLLHGASSASGTRTEGIRPPQVW